MHLIAISRRWLVWKITVFRKGYRNECSQNFTPKIKFKNWFLYFFEPFHASHHTIMASFINYYVELTLKPLSQGTNKALKWVKLILEHQWYRLRKKSKIVNKWQVFSSILAVKLGLNVVQQRTADLLSPKMLEASSYWSM